MKLADLADLSLTYPDVGATAATLPAGYANVRMSRRIGSGRQRFEQAAGSVMRYGMLRGAGLRVTASTEVAQVGSDVLGRLGPFVAPCRVVYVVDEPNRRGFAYGSLPGTRSRRRNVSRALRPGRRRGLQRGDRVFRTGDLVEQARRSPAVGGSAGGVAALSARGVSQWV